MLTDPAPRPRGAHAHRQARLADVQPGDPLEQHLHGDPSLRSMTDGRRPEGPLPGNRPARSWQQSMGTRGPRAIHIYGLTRTTVWRRRRTTGAFSSARTAIKIATDHTSCISGWMAPAPASTGPAPPSGWLDVLLPVAILSGFRNECPLVTSVRFGLLTLDRSLGLRQPADACAPPGHRHSRALRRWMESRARRNRHPQGHPRGRRHRPRRATGAGH